MYRLQRILSTAVVLLAVVALAACDSGVDPASTSDGPAPTVITFDGPSTNAIERDTTVTITLVLQNPSGNEVSAELLFANAASSASPSDFNITDGRVIGEDTSAVVLETITFPASAEDGATRTLTLTLTDNADEPEAEVGIFTLQNIMNALPGQAEFRVNIGAEGAVPLLEQGWDDDTFGDFTQYSVATDGPSTYWELVSPSQSDIVPLAQANAFNGGYAADDWLISPAVNLAGFDGATLSFTSARNFGDDGLERALLVKVSSDYTDSGSPANATWTEVGGDATLSSGGYEEVESGDLDISQFVGEESVYVAFQYLSSGNGGGSSELWRVDNINVIGEE